MNKAVQEMEKFLLAAINGARDDLMDMLVYIDRSSEDTTGDVFDVIAKRAEIATLKRCLMRLRNIRRSYPE